VARWNEAIQQILPRNYGPGMAGGRPQAVTLHHVAGNGNPYNTYLSRGVSAHFWIPYSGKPYQHVDTSQQAWHGIQHNAYSIGVETEGCGAPPHADPLNENQLMWFGRLMAWANRVHGIPLVLSEHVTQRGLNYHRCPGGPNTGCPCDRRKNQRGEILRRAKGGAAAPAPPAGGPDSLEELIMFWIDFTREDAAPVPIVIPNAYTDGKARLRFASNSSVEIRVDWPEADNRDIKLSYGAKAQGCAIPKNISFAVIRRREGTGRVACTYSR
jgi:hypothetical protein